MLMVTPKVDRKIAAQALRTMRDEVGGTIKGQNLYPLADAFAGLIVSPPVLSLNRQTYIVQTMAQQEFAVAAAMRDLGVDAWVPTEPKSKRVNAVQRRIVNAPMLACYALPIFDEHRDDWRKIPTIKGVIRLFMFRERPLPVATTEIQKIKMREAELNDGGLSRLLAKTVADVGDCVQIIDHPAFFGHIGMVTGANPDKWRLKVEVDIFGQKVSIDLSANQVRLAG